MRSRFCVVAVLAMLVLTSCALGPFQPWNLITEPDHLYLRTLDEGHVTMELHDFVTQC